jgi:hypothetical protein
MERRGEIRYKVSDPVSVTVLDPPGQTALSGVLVDIAGSGMCLDLSSAVPCGTPVKVETDSMLLLAEVRRCEQRGESYRVALAIEHGLDLAVLRQLNRALMGLDQEEASDHSSRASSPLGT